jgi:predicted esterase
MAQLAKDLGGAILVGHSQSSSFPTRAALLDPTGVKGIIQLETGCFGNLTPAHINVLKNIPILIMEGDHYPTDRPVAPCPAEIAQLQAAGGDITYIHLRDIGMHGNSHMFMQDNNNLQIADVLIQWIDEHVRGRSGR